MLDVRRPAAGVVGAAGRFDELRAARGWPSEAWHLFPASDRAERRVPGSEIVGIWWSWPEWSWAG